MPAQDVAGFLRASPVFAALPAREVAALGGGAVEEPHRAREYIFMEGDPAPWLCIVRSGRVKILRHSRAGKDVVLDLLGPGEIFGGVAVRGVRTRRVRRPPSRPRSSRSPPTRWWPSPSVTPR